MRRGVRLLLCAGSPLALHVIAFAQQASQTVDARARAVAAASRARTSDSDALLSNVVTPGLAGKPIATVDGKTRFAPSITCTKSATLLELLVQPGPTGDLRQVRIARDRDFDGAFDSQTLLPEPISGVCANGVIACDPGTWKECRAFAWSVDESQNIGLVQTTMPQLAGCYCLNNSCGTDLAWGNMAGILKDLGGGVVGALTTADPRIGVAQAQVEGPVIRYTGAQTTACAANHGVDQTRYRAAPELLGGDAAAVAAASSIFQAVKASPGGLGKAQQVSACTISREIGMSSPDAQAVITRSSGGYATTAPTPDRLSFLMGSPSDDSLKGGKCGLFDFRMTIDVRDRERLKAVRLARYYADDWAQVRVDGQQVASGPSPWTGMGLPPGKCEKSGPFHAAPAMDLTAFMTPGPHEIWLRVAVGDEGEAFAQIDADLDLACRASERVVDLCAGYAGQSHCRLKDETVDGVATFRSGVATGLSPLPQTRTVGTGACTTQIGRDFFLRERRYTCTIDTGSTASPDLSRSAYIIDRSTPSLLADRARTADGGFQETARSFALPDRGSVPTCEPVCKTRSARVNSDAAADGVVGALQNTPQGWDTYYHACNAQNVCPAGPSEEIVSACGCLDDFPEAVAMMQTVRLAGADLVCTATVP
ncbi:conjugal transfer protein TraN [soil metagenome]